MSNRFRHLCLAMLVTISIVGVAFAQKDMGSILGTVKDSSGAMMPGAKVTITDVDRGTSFETTTNASGEYAANPLRIGRYNITVEKQGFRKQVVGPIEVNVQARAEVNISLHVGQIAETITVTSEGPQLETETSELGQVVSGKQATTLPLNGRNFAQLAQPAAGVAPAEPGSRTETSFGFSSNGARALQNNYLLDGIDNNANLGDVLNGSAYVIQPSVDAIGEFKVQTNSHSAEFGRGNGAIMNAVIKSGTNAFHGNAYEFFRNDKLDDGMHSISSGGSLISRISSELPSVVPSLRVGRSSLSTTKDCAGQVEPVAIEVGTPQEGQFQAARDPRLIQFALKFYF